MCKKGFWEFDYDGNFGAVLLGFYDDDDFLKAIDILRKEVGMGALEYHWPPYEGLVATSKEDDIEINWKFNNWDNIICETRDCNDEAKKEKFRSWIQKLFCSLLRYTNADLYTCESKENLPLAMFFPYNQKRWCINKNFIEFSKDISVDIINEIKNNKIQYILVDEIKYW